MEVTRVRSAMMKRKIRTTRNVFKRPYCSWTWLHVECCNGLWVLQNGSVSSKLASLLACGRAFQNIYISRLYSAYPNWIKLTILKHSATVPFAWVFHLPTCEPVVWSHSGSKCYQEARDAYESQCLKTSEASNGWRIKISRRARLQAASQSTK